MADNEFIFHDITKKKHITGVNTKGKDTYIIPKHVTTIGIKAFSGCTQLTHITIPENVAIINSQAFMRLEMLHTVIFEKRTILLEIKSYAFGHCPNLSYFQSLGGDILLNDFVFPATPLQYIKHKYITGKKTFTRDTNEELDNNEEKNGDGNNEFNEEQYKKNIKNCCCIS